MLAFWIALPALLGALVWLAAGAMRMAAAAGGWMSPAASAERTTAEMGAGVYAVWSENQSGAGVVWVARPDSPRERRELLRLQGESILSAAVSGDGGRIAVVSQSAASPLASLRVFRPAAAEATLVDEAAAIDNLSWSPDGRLAYICEMPAAVEIMGKEGAAVAMGRVRALRIWEPDANAVRLSASAAPGEPLMVNGWTADGRALLYSSPAAGGGRLGADGTGAPAFDGGSMEGTPLQVDPGGRRILAGTAEELFAASLDGRARVRIAQAGLGFSAAWSRDGAEVMLTSWESAQSRMILRAVDVESGAERDVRELPAGGAWRLLAASPDGAWIAAYQYDTGYYLIPFDPAAALMRIPQDEDPVGFVGWREVR